MLKTNLMRDPVGCLYSGGLSLFWWTEYFGVLSLFWWAIFVVLGCLYSIGRTFLVCYLYSGGPYVLVDYLHSGGPSVFWWAAYNLSLLSCGQSNEIVDFFSVVCPHFAQHTSKCLFY